MLSSAETSPVRRYWIAVACEEHALRGARSQPGFMQVCHGKKAPLARVRPGDVVTYYAPTLTMGGRQRRQAFVTLGLVLPREPYLFDMGGGFVPWRRDVRYWQAQPAPIAPLLDPLGWSQDGPHWGMRLRFGLAAIAPAQMHCIAQAMGVDGGALQ